MKNKAGTTATLKGIGLRVTPQRQAILKLLDGNRTHPSADSIYQAVRREYPGISFATVYNTLSKLARAGKVQELDIDPSKKRFDPNTASHHHFYCTVCGQVVDIESDISFAGKDSPMEAKTVDGHRVDAVQLNFKGVCKDCAARARRGTYT